MTSRRLSLLALLATACPHAQPTPQPPPTIDANDPDATSPDSTPDPHEPDPPVTHPADTTDPPRFSTPKRDGSLADTLPAPSPSSGLPGTCEGGTRRPGETWKVDCNECSCGDDGQSRCTAMACLPTPVR